MSVATVLDDLSVAQRVAGEVRDPELPMLTLADLGVLREVRLDGGTVVVSVTPTYSGCPATATIRSDLVLALWRAGFGDVEVRTVLHPAWSSDWITAQGRAALAAHGIAPPGAAPREAGPVPLVLGRREPSVACPRCGSARTEEVSWFGATACLSQHRCRGCLEPFDHVKEL